MCVIFQPVSHNLLDTQIPKVFARFKKASVSVELSFGRTGKRKLSKKGKSLPAAPQIDNDPVCVCMLAYVVCVHLNFEQK